MSLEIAMRREGNRLAPVDPISEEDLQKVPLAKDVLVTVRTPRNLRQFRMAWALAAKVAASCDFLHDSEDAMDWLKIKARHVKMIQDPRTQQVAIIPKSIAFASLSQDAFKRVLDRMVYVVCSDIVPGLDESSLRREIEDMVGTK